MFNLLDLRISLGAMGAGMLLAFAPGVFAQSAPEAPGPASSSSLRQEAFNAMSRGDYPAAESALMQARKLAPDDAYVLLNLGSVYAKECRTDEAVALFKQVAERDRADAPTKDPFAGIAIGGASKDINDGMQGKSPAYIARYNLTRVKPCAVAQAPARKTLTVLSAMQLFAFDSAILASVHPDLERIAVALRERPQGNQQIVIKGYTDELGGDDYNRELSQRRADAVKAYFVKLQHLPEARIVALGLGSSAPRVQCPAMPRDELIACLAPNRRIEIDQLTFEGVAQ